MRRKQRTPFTRTIRLLITAASYILFAIFTLIQFRNFPFYIVASNITPILLWQAGLWLYYFSWINGTLFDVRVQEEVYVAFPENVPGHGFLTILILTVAGAALLWTERDIQRFAIAIDIFIVVDHLAWRYLIWLIKPIVSDSQKIYIQNRNYFSLAALETVAYHIRGNWKWWRFVGTMPIIVPLNAFAFSSTVQSHFTTTVMVLLPIFSSVEDAIAFISGTFVLLFVLVAEIWSWVIRVNTAISLELINKLADEYLLVRTTDVLTRLSSVTSLLAKRSRVTPSKNEQ